MSNVSEMQDNDTLFSKTRNMYFICSKCKCNIIINKAIVMLSTSFSLN